MQPGDVPRFRPGVVNPTRELNMLSGQVGRSQVFSIPPLFFLDTPAGTGMGVQMPTETASSIILGTELVPATGALPSGDFWEIVLPTVGTYVLRSSVYVLLSLPAATPTTMLGAKVRVISGAATFYPGSESEDYGNIVWIGFNGGGATDAAGVAENAVNFVQVTAAPATLRMNLVTFPSITSITFTYLGVKANEPHAVKLKDWIQP